LKQLGLALHSYHDVREKFPLGSRNDKPLPLAAPRTTYLIELYPYLEQEPTYRRWDPNVLVGTPDAYGGAIPRGGSSNWLGPQAPTRTVVRNLQCPSDGMGGDTSTYSPGGLELGTWNHSNYLAFFGARNYGTALMRPDQRRAAFGINYGARLADISNG